jgi:arsenate reductase
MYGIKNCGTVKKARVWLEERGIDYRFHDFKKDGLDAAKLDEWLDSAGWDVLLNKRGTTWRKLAPARKENVGAAEARQLMLENASIIKRPVLEYNGGCLVGFDAEHYATALQ